MTEVSLDEPKPGASASKCWKVVVGGGGVEPEDAAPRDEAWLADGQPEVVSRKPLCGTGPGHQLQS